MDWGWLNCKQMKKICLKNFQTKENQSEWKQFRKRKAHIGNKQFEDKLLNFVCIYVIWRIMFDIWQNFV